MPVAITILITGSWVLGPRSRLSVSFSYVWGGLLLPGTAFGFKSGRFRSMQVNQNCVSLQSFFFVLPSILWFSPPSFPPPRPRPPPHHLFILLLLLLLLSPIRLLFALREKINHVVGPATKPVNQESSQLANNVILVRLGLHLECKTNQHSASTPCPDMMRLVVCRDMTLDCQGP